MTENLEIKRWFFKYLIALDFRLSCRAIKGYELWGNGNNICHLLCWDILLWQKRVKMMV